MAIQTLFQRSKNAVTDSTNAIAETVKSIVHGPSVAEKEADFIEAEADLNRTQAQYDDDPSPDNKIVLQSARAHLQDVESDLASARRRETKHLANLKSRKKQDDENQCEAAIARFKKYGEEAVEPMIENAATVILAFIAHRNEVLATAAIAKNEAAGQLV